MPSNNTRQRYSVKIADRSTHSRRGIDDIAVLEASIIRRQRVLDIERHPVRFGRSAVDEKHDAERDRVHDCESDGEPDAPIPFFGVGACDQTAVEEQDRDFGAAAAYQKGELREPHTEHGVGAQVGLDVPDVAAAVGALGEDYGDGGECEGGDPGGEEEAL